LLKKISIICACIVPLLVTGPFLPDLIVSFLSLWFLYYSLKKGGSFITYCAKGQVKRDLKSVGFEVETLPGPPGKREMTRGRKL
jgi:hypothetical protein